jgi:hypothetical protein
MTHRNDGLMDALVAIAVIDLLADLAGPPEVVNALRLVPGTDVIGITPWGDPVDIVVKREQIVQVVDIQQFHECTNCGGLVVLAAVQDVVVKSGRDTIPVTRVLFHLADVEPVKSPLPSSVM